MTTLKPKRQGGGLMMRTIVGKKSGQTYLVFRTLDGSFHVFVETEAKAAAIDCGSQLPANEANTRQHWAAALEIEAP